QPSLERKRVWSGFAHPSAPALRQDSNFCSTSLAETDPPTEPRLRFQNCRRKGDTSVDPLASELCGLESQYRTDKDHQLLRHYPSSSWPRWHSSARRIQQRCG